MGRIELELEPHVSWFIVGYLEPPFIASRIITDLTGRN